MRGRNRRGPNPLARSYESNGPDVKVRGTAQHIADRYLQLARDAQSSGDPVTAESYFQYAEHYLRIIAAAQEQMQAQYGYRPPAAGGEEDGDGEEGDGEGFGAPYANGPQNGGFNGQPRPAQFQPNSNGGEGDDQPPMFSPPPRERFENRNQRFEQRDGWRQNRNDGNRNDGNRSDGNRSEGNRSEGSRNEGSRSDGTRTDGSRFDNSRRDNQRRDQGPNDSQRRDGYRRDVSGEGGAPSEPAGEPRQQQARAHGEGDIQHGGEPRRQQREAGEGRENDRPHRERFERQPRPVASEEQVLPSFITAPVRAAAPAPEAPVEAAVDANPEFTPPQADTPAPAPRARRGRPRRVAEPSPSGEEGAAASGDDASPVAAK